MLTETLNTNADQVAAEQVPVGPVYRPAVDIVESGHAITLWLDLPGAAPDRLDVNYHDGALSVRGTVPSRQSSGAEYVRREYGVGDFQRTFQVNEHIDAEKIEAHFDSGVLRLTLPKMVNRQPRKIAVSAK